PTGLSRDQSFTAMLMVILGGSGTVAGPIVGAIIITGLKYELSTLWVNYWPIILGIIYVFVTVYLPNGVVSGVAGLVRRLAASVPIADGGLPAAGGTVPPRGDTPLAAGGREIAVLLAAGRRGAPG